MWPGRLAPCKAINWVAGLGGQLLSHLFPLLSHSLLSPLWKWVSGRRKIREGSQGSQFCSSSSYPLPGPWAFSLRPLELKGWVAGVLLDKSWGAAQKDSIPCQLFTLSPKANIAVLGQCRQEVCEGDENHCPHFPLTPTNYQNPSPCGQRESRAARAGRCGF